MFTEEGTFLRKFGEKGRGDSQEEILVALALIVMICCMCLNIHTVAIIVSLCFRVVVSLCPHSVLREVDQAGSSKVLVVSQWMVME